MNSATLRKGMPTSPRLNSTQLNYEQPLKFSLVTFNAYTEGGAFSLPFLDRNYAHGSFSTFQIVRKTSIKYF